LAQPIDITGQRFGRWTVLHQVLGSQTGSARWACRCDCGTEAAVRAQTLRDGASTSCGCSFRHVLHVGEVIGRWTVVDRGPNDSARSSQWVCRCACGTERLVRADRLRAGKSKSCGCQRVSMRGLTAEGVCWRGMKQRCRNPNNPAYPSYGGRGITVCERWNSFENFYADMGPRPSPQHSIDRWPNNDGNYEPGNCRWATKSEQNENRRPRHLWPSRATTPPPGAQP
jgi:hypothetical protein